MNKQLIIAGGILLLLVLGAGAVFFAAPRLAPEGNPPAEEPRTEELNTYSSTELGLAFRYPANYELRQSSGEKGAEYEARIMLAEAGKADAAGGPVPGEPGMSITVDVYPLAGGMTAEKWIIDSPDSNYRFAAAPYRLVSIGGKEFATFSWSGLYEGDTAVHAENGRLYVVTATYIAPDDMTRSDLWNVILPTFMTAP
ncbi:MAG TPA: hypothetical protein VHF05_02335 [Candidatus Paceibacterota bacterium]|nr:hypothetical protein [Candidatus Paceibacterota bacterium]